MNIGIMHYSVPPVVGGVEAVIRAHAGLLLQAGYPVTLIAGAGDSSSLPDGVKFNQVQQMDSRHPRVVEISRRLQAGQKPVEFEHLAAKLVKKLKDAVNSSDLLIVHNI